MSHPAPRPSPSFILARRNHQRRNLQWYKKVYTLLKAALGNVCASCGYGYSFDDLIVHHVHGKDYESNKLRMDRRVRKLVEEWYEWFMVDADAGTELQLMCKPCHNKHHKKGKSNGTKT